MIQMDCLDASGKVGAERLTVIDNVAIATISLNWLNLSFLCWRVCSFGHSVFCLLQCVCMVLDVNFRLAGQVLRDDFFTVVKVGHVSDWHFPTCALDLGVWLTVEMFASTASLLF